MLKLANMCFKLTKTRSFHKSTVLKKLVDEIKNQVDPYSKIKILSSTSHNLKISNF